ncbi:shugoshin 1 [Pitangus sulphuratus]|nr:shugoshin 1 [Pitangus sulphuratus]
MTEYSRKSFRDSLRDIKQRMKEKRNQKWAKLGKTTQFSTVKAKRATSSSSKMKIIQANNRDLALSLQEEKLKLREAEATILQLRKDYHNLKAQMVDLQRIHRFQQEQGLVENRLSALNEIISKVSQNLLDSIDLLGPAKNLCSIDMVLETVAASQVQGWTFDIHMDNMESELENISSGEKAGLENVNAAISHLNEGKVDSEQVLRPRKSETAQFNLKHNFVFKQPECKSRENSQRRKKKHQKGVLKQPKNTSKKAPGKRDKEASKKKLNFLGGISDAYDFHLEESVHVTPFRQNKVNDRDTAVDDTQGSDKTDSFELSDTEDDLDDSLYEPYKSKSKKMRSSVDDDATSPIRPRPRSKRCWAQREQKLCHEEETENNKSSDKSISKCSKCSGIGSVSLEDNIV